MFPRRPPSFLTAALLAVALLIAQGLGGLHRVAHAGMQFTQSVAPASADDSLSHSCAAFDAATLGDVFDTPLTVVACPLEADGLPRDAISTSWTALTACPFHSRAPPAA